MIEVASFELGASVDGTYLYNIDTMTDFVTGSAEQEKCFPTLA
jgi:hypothetical protein